MERYTEKEKEIDFRFSLLITTVRKLLGDKSAEIGDFFVRLKEDAAPAEVHEPIDLVGARFAAMAEVHKIRKQNG